MNPPIIFCGPTIDPDSAARELDAVFLPPAAQGDVYRAVLDGPVAIGLIDGFFDSVDAVAHKEILWAMSQGVHVYGSASMGALRAVELATFGMRGAGDIVRWYRSGLLEDDDEVALVHGDADTGYRALSVAMVDIRATLEAAENAGVIGADTAAALVATAKALFYADRAYPLILARGRERGLPGHELDALQDFLPGGAVAQKRRDAVAMLRLMRDEIARGLAPMQVRYHLSTTDAWRAVQKRALAR